MGKVISVFHFREPTILSFFFLRLAKRVKFTQRRLAKRVKFTPCSYPVKGNTNNYIILLSLSCSVLYPPPSVPTGASGLSDQTNKDGAQVQLHGRVSRA